MAIKGSLGEASLGDVCQLLALGRKTGGLSMTDRSRFGQIFFERGRIIYAHVVNRRDRLGDLLVRDGVLDAAALVEVLDLQARRPQKRLGELLIERGLIDAEVLGRYVRRQIEEAIYHLFTWTRGTFFFEPDERPEARDIVVSINPDVLLLEAARRVDEWAVIERRIPTLALVFEVEHAWLRAAGIELTAEQRIVVPLLDGTRSVGEVIDASRLGELEAASAIYGLVEAGLAHHTGERAPTDARPAGAELMERRNLANAFFRSRLFAEARHELEAILALRADDLDARFRLALVALHERKAADAVRELTEVLERGGARYGAFLALAHALRTLGRQADALLVLEEAEALRPGAREVALARGMNRLEQHELGGARAAFAEYVRRLLAGQQPVPVYFHYDALAAALGGALGEAGTILERGLRLYPDCAPLLLLRGLVEERRGEDAAAAHWYMRAAEQDPACGRAHRSLGDLAERADRPREALAHFRRALEADPAIGGDVHARIGNLLYAAGDFTGAVRQWNRALELNPADQAVRNQLTIVKHAAG